MSAKNSFTRLIIVGLLPENIKCPFITVTAMLLYYSINVSLYTSLYIFILLHLASQVKDFFWDVYET